MLCTAEVGNHRCAYAALHRRKCLARTLGPVKLPRRLRVLSFNIMKERVDAKVCLWLAAFFLAGSEYIYSGCPVG